MLLATFETLAKQEIRQVFYYLQDQTGGIEGSGSKNTICIQLKISSNLESLKFLLNDCQPKTISFRVSTSNLGHLHG